MPVKNFFKKSLVPLGLVGSIGGFIGDVLKRSPILDSYFLCSHLLEL
ncbi:MAG: hypothetical protein IPI04_20215 [Ignavibacteria bacterium]|nr:hypothetical protein [Ignavibacteria bacterium]